MRKTVCTLIFAVLAGLSALGQCPVGSPTTPQPCVTGQYNAILYNYGGQPAQLAPAALKVDIGNSVTGATSITVRVNATMATIYGDTFMPFATNAPILVGGASNQELVTPTTVSCSTPTQVGTCTITATFANTHGGGEPIASGTFGAQEAVNRASMSAGGYALVDQLWAKAGGTTAVLAGTATGNIGNVSFVANATYEPNAVFVKDVRTGIQTYWFGAPGLTNISTPTAPTTASNLTTSTTGGSIATSTTPRFTITAVDQFGGETAASADTASTTTLVDGAGSTNSYGLSSAVFPTGTGIVGYRLYVSASGGGTQTETLVAPAQMTFTPSTICPLAGCILPGTAVTLTALPATTAAGPPQGTSAAATALNSAHTTVINRNANLPPSMLPFSDTAAPGYWPVTVTSATTLAAGFDVMGELQYPAGYFNTLGSAYRICGGGVVTPSAATVAGTWNIRIGPRENSAGTSGEHAVVPFGFVASNQWTAAASHFDFCTDITVSTTGTSGVMEGSGTSFCVVVAAGNDGAGTDTCVGAFNAASTATDLTQQGVVQLSYVQTAASWTLPQLRYLTIRRL